MIHFNGAQYKVSKYPIPFLFQQKIRKFVKALHEHEFSGHIFFAKIVSILRNSF